MIWAKIRTNERIGVKMSEQDQNSSADSGSANTDVIGLLKKVQQQLEFLEKKLDTLIKQSQDKPFGEKRFSKPFNRPYSGNSYRGKGDHDRGSRDREFNQRPSFEKRREDQDQRFAPKKKPFFDKRKQH